MKTVTQGEKLFLLIRDRVLGMMGSKGRKWEDFERLLADAGGRDQVEHYLKGAISVHGMRRMLRYWEDEYEKYPEALHVKKVATFIRNEVFIGLEQAEANGLARAVISAHRASDKAISSNVRKNVLKGNSPPKCYLCDRTLDASAPENDSKFLTLEHLWPSSIGGNSIEENLLPACKTCQDITKDTMSWEWFNIHNLVLPTEPSEGALKSIDKKAKYAVHFRQALALSDASHSTLKDAFLQLGRMNAELTYKRTGVPITFFDLRT